MDTISINSHAHLLSSVWIKLEVGALTLSSEIILMILHSLITKQPMANMQVKSGDVVIAKYPMVLIITCFSLEVVVKVFLHKG